MVSFSWKYFTKINKKSAKCSIDGCQRTIQIQDSATTGLIRHLRTVHGISEGEKNTPLPPAKKQKIIVEFLKFSTFDETIARHVCEYGANFNQLSKNEYLRDCMLRDFKQYLPTKPANVAKHFDKFYEDVRSKTVSRIRSLLDNGRKFSVTTDEWTANTKKRYLNININFLDNQVTRFINLGLVPIKGSCNASNLKELVSECFI